MSSFTLPNTPFPTGTSVSAYDAQGYSTFPASPPGNPIATATVTAGSLTFTGLTDGHSYFAAAKVGGNWKGIAFHVGADGPPPGIPEDISYAGVSAGDVLVVNDAGDGYEFDGSVAVIKEGPINVEYPEYGADGTRATDSIAAFEAAIAALPAEGGKILAPRRYQLSKGLNCEGKRSVTIEGETGIGTGGDPRSQLLFTQSGSSAAINAKKTHGFSMEALSIQYNNASFTGPLIDCEEAFKAVLRLLHLNSSGLESAYGINLNKAECFTLFGGQIGGGLETGIKGKATNEAYANVAHVQDTLFKESKTTHISNAGEAWKLDNCTFEPLINGKAGTYTSDSGVLAYGLVFDTCWWGDANTEGTQILFRGKGLTVRGGSLGSGALGISVPDTTSDAVNVAGVRFGSLTDAIRLNFGAGTQRYVIGANAYESSVSGKKVSLDNGSTDAGAGFLSH